MACMEYECRRCKHFWSNNQPLGLAGCPRCCSQDVRKDFDEPLSSWDDPEHIFGPEVTDINEVEISERTHTIWREIGGTG